LAKCIEEENHADKEIALEFINSHKYDSRFEVAMRFFVKQLPSTGKVILDDMISIIDREPRDIIRRKPQWCSGSISVVAGGPGFNSRLGNWGRIRLALTARVPEI